VGDDKNAIITALEEATGKYDHVLVTGGGVDPQKMISQKTLS